MIDLDLDGLRAAAGIGVAGNFAGHLEQAGEAGDFVNVADADPQAPKGIFPWYLPQDHSFLGEFPLAGDRLVLPDSREPLDLQIEPEAGVLFHAHYSADRLVALEPFALAAFNDCSIRRPGARKISEKKNWGAASKGIAVRAFETSDLDVAGPSGVLRLASFLRRDGFAHPYGVDSPLSGYSYFGARLVDWIVERVNHQTGSVDDPLEPVGTLLTAAGCPKTIVVGIGATRYTAFGENTYLVPGDESIVIAYDSGAHRPSEVEAAVARNAEDDLQASVLRQRIAAAA